MEKEKIDLLEEIERLIDQHGKEAVMIAVTKLISLNEMVECENKRKCINDI